ncbi:YfbM family protein [Pedobacter sp. MC2016-14]|uniref:YfbM family protein n=1 Tax=Pedobacter sp. MC2016-14 TaxID=2897327 RepID=UPI001E3F49AA|nr:YfbM family protein [Pedobacter sp. MC2016-14]MCD0488335.1 YfbM family protein [Pedobacter sp. MC2016-14]
MSMIGYLLRVTPTELAEYLEESSLLEDRIYGTETEDANLVDLDKAWEGIIFLLTGQSLAEADHPLLSTLFSGQLIDEEQDLGYGPAHYLTPEQVVEINKEISKIEVADLKQKFDPDKMGELGIYPEIWDEGDEAFDYLAEYFVNLKQAYSLAAENGEAIVTYLS